MVMDLHACEATVPHEGGGGGGGEGGTDLDGCEAAVS